METITTTQANLITALINDYIRENGITKMSKKLENYIEEEFGLVYKCLGTSKTARTSSLEIDIKNIRSKKYLNGKYFVVGTASKSIGGGTYYFGYVAKIEDYEF